jgi:hypothetical protein
VAFVTHVEQSATGPVTIHTAVVTAVDVELLVSHFADDEAVAGALSADAADLMAEQLRAYADSQRDAEAEQ